MRLKILALEGVLDSALSTVLDTFVTANQLAARERPDAPHYVDLKVIGVRSEVRTSFGMTVPLHSGWGLSADDWLVIPAIDAKMPDLLLPALARDDVREAVALVREHHANGGRIATACISSFVVAASGLLDNLRATTSWWLSPLFRQLYPEVLLDTESMLVPSGAFVTAGAAMGHLDLALWLLSQSSPDLAALVARYLMVDARPSQAPYLIPNHLARADPLVERFERWARARLTQGFSLEAAAATLAVGPRTLQRRIEAVLGKSPLSYFQDLRVERAVHLLRTTRLDIEKIAEAVGYAEGATLRTLLRRRLGRGIREIRGR